MSDTVRVPDPVFDRIERQAEREDVAKGVVVKQWMEKAEKYEEMETMGRDL